MTFLVAVRSPTAAPPGGQCRKSEGGDSSS